MIAAGQAGVKQVLEDEAEQPLIVTRELAAAASRLLTGIGGSTPPDWAPPVLVAAIPLLLDLILRPFGAGSAWRAFAWMVAGAVLNVALLGSSTWGWRRVQRLGKPIDRMLPCEKRAAYAASVAQKLHLGPGHYLLCVGGAAVGAVGSYFASKHLPPDTFGPAYYLGIALLGFLAADTLRWLVRAPLILLRPLTRVTPLRVVMHAPAMTPAIREMGDLAAETAIRAAFGFFLFGLPLVWAALSAKHSPHGHHPSHAEWIGILSLAPLAISAATVAYVTFVPQRWLSTIIQTERNRVLDELAATLPEQGADKLLTDVPTRTMALYNEVATATTATAEGRVIFRRALVFVGALLPQLYTLAIKLLHLPLVPKG